MLIKSRRLCNRSVEFIMNLKERSRRRELTFWCIHCCLSRQEKLVYAIRWDICRRDVLDANEESKSV